MERNITVAKSWNQLNDWQLSEIAHLYLNCKTEDFEKAYEKMVFILFQKEFTQKGRKFLRELVSEVPFSELEFHARFLVKTTDLYKFPSIPGLIKPADRLQNITIRQFSVIDNFFFAWNKNRSLLNLKRLVATLYRTSDKYDDLDLPKVARYTDKLSEKQMESIALAYLFTRRHIEKKFPVVFPEPKPESESEKFKPTFKKKDTDYVVFDKVIVGMAMDELQPLGTKQEINEVRIYEFLSVLSETMLYHKAKNKVNEGK